MDLVLSLGVLSVTIGWADDPGGMAVDAYFDWTQARVCWLRNLHKSFDCRGGLSSVTLMVTIEMSDCH
jgi:hypothetical protein